MKEVGTPIEPEFDLKMWEKQTTLTYIKHQKLIAKLRKLIAKEQLIVSIPTKDKKEIHIKIDDLVANGDAIMFSVTQKGQIK